MTPFSQILYSKCMSFTIITTLDLFSVTALSTSTVNCSISFWQVWQLLFWGNYCENNQTLLHVRSPCDPKTAVHVFLTMSDHRGRWTWCHSCGLPERSTATVCLFPSLSLSPGNLHVTLSRTAVPQQQIQQLVSTCWLTFPSCLPLGAPDLQGSQLHCVSPGLCYLLASPTLSCFQRCM